MNCVVLWSCVQDLLPSFQLSPFADEKLGLLSASKVQMLGTVLAFHIYHSCSDLVMVSEELLWEKGKANFHHFIAPHFKVQHQDGE